jgi:hypothetical protein
MDPILEYLLEFNKTNSIEYSDRYIVPTGGLAQMLMDFKGFHLNREEVIKADIKPNANWRQSTIETVDELYKLLED